MSVYVTKQLSEDKVFVRYYGSRIPEHQSTLWLTLRVYLHQVKVGAKFKKINEQVKKLKE